MKTALSEVATPTTSRRTERRQKLRTRKSDVKLTERSARRKKIQRAKPKSEELARD